MVMKKFTVAKLLALVVIIAGIAVMIGWICNISLLKSITPSWVAMKFSTAICFVVSGIMLYSIVIGLEGNSDQAQIIIPAAVLIICLIMGMFFFSSFLNIRTGVEDLFVKEGASAVGSITPGRPAVSTTVGFILISIAGMLILVDSKNMQLKLKIIGSIIALIGAIAVIGYIANIPLLYYSTKGISTDMACNTAILFAILGIGLICLSD